MARSRLASRIPRAYADESRESAAVIYRHFVVSSPCRPATGLFLESLSRLSVLVAIAAKTPRLRAFTSRAVTWLVIWNERHLCTGSPTRRGV